MKNAIATLALMSTLLAVGCTPVQETAAVPEPNAPARQAVAAGVAEEGMHTAVLSVPGMSCSSCEPKVRRILAGLEGVKTVKTDVGSLTATVTFDPAKTSPAAIAGGLSKADRHYEATVKQTF